MGNTERSKKSCHHCEYKVTPRSRFKWFRRINPVQLASLENMIIKEYLVRIVIAEMFLFSLQQLRVCGGAISREVMQDHSESAC